MGPHAASPARRWRNHSLHREVDAERSRWVWKFVGGFLLASLPFAFYLLQTMSFIQTRYGLEELRKREEHLIEAERRMRIEKAVLEALPSVETRAAQELRLTRPDPRDVVVVEPSQVSRPAPPGRPAAAAAR